MKIPPNPAQRLRSMLLEDMNLVDQTIAQRAQTGVPPIPDLGKHIISAGGKRLRPMLTLAAARLCGQNNHTPILLAAAVELMHTATLLHDDVVDDADKRRGRPAPRQIWGNPASVLAGDFLLGKAFELMVEPESLDALHTLSRAAAVIAQGELLQLAAAKNGALHINQYLQIIHAKTATLFAAAARSGGALANPPNQHLNALHAYGLNLGVAFQLADDAIDYQQTKSNNSPGKIRGADFREGKTTLPVILAYRRADASQRQFWDQALTHGGNPDDFPEACRILQLHNALHDARKHAASYAKIAQNSLLNLPNSPWRDTLHDLADFCASRDS